ncbi:MAG: polymer-forming cytoskeletal protein, partial [Patescibacteria group bacterium]
SLNIKAVVGGDLILAGGTVSLAEEARVGGDLWAVGGTINLNNFVAGEGKLAGGDIFINGTIVGDLEVWSGERLIFGPQSRVSGPITHYGRAPAVIESGAQVGTINFRPPPETKFPFSAGLGALVSLKLLALVVTGLILLKLFRAKLTIVVVSVRQKFWRNLLVGLVSFLVLPPIIILSMMSVVGIYAGIILTTFFALVLAVNVTVVTLLLGSLVEKLITKEPEIKLAWPTIVWGALAYGALALIPIVGWLVIIGLYLATFGALLRSLKNHLEV